MITQNDSALAGWFAGALRAAARAGARWVEIDVNVIGGFFREKYSASSDAVSLYGLAALAPGARPARPVRVHHLTRAKERGERLTMLTAYDAVTARILDEAGTDMLLVGDSIGNVMLGHDTTLPVELDEMVVATRSVARATTRALVVADLPFGTYEAGPEQALASAVRMEDPVEI